MHADQRLKTFNFYLSLSAVTTGAFVAFAKEATDWRWLSLLPLMLSFITFVFWKFEQRNKMLVRNGEAALKYLDNLLPIVDEPEENQPHVLRIFHRDEHLSGQGDRATKQKMWTYSTCFNAVFLVFGLSGVSLALVCLLKGS